MEENEVVVAVRTNTDWPGFLQDLEITTSTGRKKSWGDLNYKDYTNGEKRRSAVVNARLAFCSGAVETSGLGNGRSLTFHWVMD